MSSTSTEVLDTWLGQDDAMRERQSADGTLECFATARVWTCRQLECQWRRKCLLELAYVVAAET